MHEAEGVNNRLLMLGSRLTLNNLTCYLDYYRAWEDIDRHGIVSADAAAAGLTDPVDESSSYVTLRNVRYQSLVAYLQYQFTPHWPPQLWLPGRPTVDSRSFAGCPPLIGLCR